MRVYLLFFCLITLLGKHRLWGQADSDSYFQLTYQNDYFTATDYYFTQGIRLEAGAPLFRKFPLAPLLLRLVDAPTETHTFFIAQEGYTPTSIRTDIILRGDRPYAGALYLGQQLTSTLPGKQWRLRSTLKLGVIGPWALVAEEQKYIHRKTGNIEPMGWQYQIRNDLLLNYELQIDRQLHSSRWLQLEGGAHLRAGTFRNRLGIQARTSAGWIDDDFAARPLRSGNRFFIFAQSSVSLIAYDATLQGGIFNRSSVYTIPGNQLKRLLLFQELGCSLKLGNWRLSYSQSYLSPEFNGGRPHAWGTAQVRIGF